MYFIFECARYKISTTVGNIKKEIRCAVEKLSLSKLDFTFGLHYLCARN